MPFEEEKSRIFSKYVGLVSLTGGSMVLREPFHELPFKGTPIVKQGETLFEIITKEDGFGFGLALARIVQTEPHYHNRTRELYVVVSGMLDLEIGRHMYTRPEVSYKLGTGKRAHSIPIKRVHQASAYHCGVAWVYVYTFPPFDPADYHVLR